ncbi:MAG: insulinase family protein [Spirulinaceae cyanobacterium SM2_1_0]|nr:insulinase family protein [Spirulinaceae cyanobacterium SM2_1_0]
MQQISPTRTAAIAFPGQCFRLENNLTVIHQHLPATPVAVVDVWVRAGTNAEPDDWYGMAHFLEHMIFKGSRRVAPGEFDWAIENSGGLTNAATSHDYAHFFIATAAQNLSSTLPYFADILLDAAIPEEEFARERDVVLEEIRSCQDDPDWLGFQALCETLYQNADYGRSILGTEAQVCQRTPNQMRCFHRTLYQPENMTVAIVGGLDQETALALVHKTFNPFGVRSECPPRTRHSLQPLTDIRRTELRLPRLEQARLLLGWLAPGSTDLDTACGLDLLAALLAGGRSSRLIRELREERRLVLDISSEFSLQQGASLLTIAAWLEPQYLEVVEAAIAQQLSELHHHPVAPAELARAKRQLCNDYAFATETPAQLAGLYGYYNTVATAAQSVLYPERIQRLQAEDLQALATQYLHPDCYAVVTLRSL